MSGSLKLGASVDASTSVTHANGKLSNSASVKKSGSETVLGINGMVFGGMIIAGGFVLYAATKPLRRSVIEAAATPNAVTGD